MQSTDHLILAINPGSTSTKAAVYQNETPVAETTLRHPAEELEACGGIPQQKGYRLRGIEAFLREAGIALPQLNAIVARGGVLRPMDAGTYVVTQSMLEDLARPEAACHASMLGAVTAHELAGRLGLPAYIVDPVVVDELAPPARYSGIPGIRRRCVFHALNQKSVARRRARELGRHYEDCNFIVAHLGGGITVGAHRRGRVVDVNNGLEGEGPFSPERCGGLPLKNLIDMCFSGQWQEAELQALLTGSGGVRAYLGSSDILAVERQAMHEPGGPAAGVLEALAYQVAKEIGAMAAVLEGRVDSLILTGGLAHCEPIVRQIEKQAAFVGEMVVYPGEDELLALAQGALRVLTGQEEAKHYPPQGQAGSREAITTKGERYDSQNIN